MNKKTFIKILIDIVMIILFILETNLKMTGQNIHEILGLILGVIIISHLLLNIKLIKAILKNTHKTNKTKISLLVNLILLISFIIMILTGIAISRNIFSFAFENNLVLSKIHKISAYTCGIIIIIHLLFHFKYLKNVIFMVKKLNLREKLLLGLTTILLGFVGLYAIIIFFFYKELSNNKYKKDESINNIESLKTNQADLNEDDNNIEEPEIEAEEPKPTLEDYLSKLHCNGCGKRCSLLYPKCGRGQMQAKQAKAEYEQL